MPEITITGPEGRLEARYHPAANKQSPLVVILHPHPHPDFGGTMNHPVIYKLYYMFRDYNFTTLRFNFRGVGNSQGLYDYGAGELADASAALDWVESQHPDANGCWIVGFDFGAWIAMQLLMRRPEIEAYMAISPQPNIYNFDFLAPVPTSGLIVHGDKDKIAPKKEVQKFVNRLRAQPGTVTYQSIIKGANHNFSKHQPKLIKECSLYLEKRLGLVPEGEKETFLTR